MADLTVDVIVVGAGHAGIEAALAAARMGQSVALVTADPATAARMSCNPAIGGLGKGHLVREIDALGGQMGLTADATAIHFRRLNTRKGAAVRGTRVQSDKAAYAKSMAEVLRSRANLQLLAGEVKDLVVDGARLRGVHIDHQRQITCQAAVLTTGTFLSGLLHIGPHQTPGGRHGEKPAMRLSQALRAIGLRMGRLKTGTPSRLDGRTLDFARMEPQPGDQPAPRLSSWSVWPDGRPPMRQVPCHITYTNPRTHDLIRQNLHTSAVFSGAIQSAGPRYCPSIEDKVVRFADRDRHQIFVEPEGLTTHWIYPNGISTSLPASIQEELVRSICGFEQAKIVRYGYAVEYDYADPRQLLPSLQLRDVEGLYFAGQLNGTTGYEEAAAQGVIAGINAALQLQQREPVRLHRDQAYIGVLIDDLVTRGVGGEPYRMFTSRAEYRLLLREDNATGRLTPIGRKLGLIDDSRWQHFCNRQEQLDQLHGHLNETKVPAVSENLDAELRAAGSTRARPGVALAELVRRPEVDLALLKRLDLLPHMDYPDASLVIEQAELAIKYAPYIQRQRDQAARLARLEEKRLPDEMDYKCISGLSAEVCEKLNRQRPVSLAQAARIPGITPAAIALLDVYLRANTRPKPAADG